jgi:hypothetical protein
VITLPAHVSENTLSIFLMKYYDYLAAGVLIVLMPLVFARILESGLIAARGYNAFVAAIATELLRGRYSQNESKHVVGNNTWKARLIRSLGESLSCGSQDQRA